MATTKLGIALIKLVGARGRSEPGAVPGVGSKGA
jgi:hypothetical protein